MFGGSCRSSDGVELQSERDSNTASHVQIALHFKRCCALCAARCADRKSILLLQKRPEMNSLRNPCKRYCNIECSKIGGGGAGVGMLLKQGSTACNVSVKLLTCLLFFFSKG